MKGMSSMVQVIPGGSAHFRKSEQQGPAVGRWMPLARLGWLAGRKAPWTGTTTLASLTYSSWHSAGKEPTSGRTNVVVRFGMKQVPFRWTRGDISWDFGTWIQQGHLLESMLSIRLAKVLIFNIHSSHERASSIKGC